MSGILRRLLTPLALLGLLVGANFAQVTTARAASGGNFFATGHDLDYHCLVGQTDECNYLKVLVDKARNGSTLPILALDQGAEVASALTAAGYPASDVVTVDPTLPAFSTTPFVDPVTHMPLYSAIVTASDSSCGGCDNTSAGESAINARSTDFTTFFNAGGGIVALAGAGNYPTYYNFVPLTGLAGANLSCDNRTTTDCFTVTPDGAALGLTNAEVNCTNNPTCQTHNAFNEPPAPFIVLERVAPGKDGANDPVTIGVLNGMIGGGGFMGGGGGAATPELGSGELLVTGLVPALGLYLLRRRRRHATAA